jgi:hypothetical protein
MSTRFCGHKTGFNPTGENMVDPNPLGPPKTEYGGRPAVPAGRLKRYPSAAADISSGNRQLAKARHGEGDGSGVVFKGSSAFGNREKGLDGKRKPAGMGSKRSRDMSDNRK